MAESWSFRDNEYLLQTCKQGDGRTFSIFEASRNLGKTYEACKEQLTSLQRSVWTEADDKELLKLCEEQEQCDLMVIAAKIRRTVDACSERLRHLIPGSWKTKEVYTFYGEMRAKISFICPQENWAFLREGNVLNQISGTTGVWIGCEHLFYHIITLATTELFKDTSLKQAMQLLLPHLKLVNDGDNSVSYHLKKSRSSAILNDKKFTDLNLEVSHSDWNDYLLIKISGQEEDFNHKFWTLFSLLRSWWFRGLPEEFLVGITEKPPNISSPGIAEKPHKEVQRKVKRTVKKAACKDDDDSLEFDEFNFFLQAALSYEPKSEAEPPKGSLSINLLKHQRVALAWMVHQERTCFGGILADDQGLGKTVSILALIISKKNTVVCDQSRGKRPAGTLIICPSSLMKQWAEELLNKISPEFKLSVLIYHGPKKTKDVEELSQFDVVITSYGTNVKSSSVFDGLAWLRVVLDEAQSIKNHRSGFATACFSLHSRCRWCLSGTPIQNSIEDIYSYLRFIKCQPYSSYTIFCEKIKKPILENPREGYKRLSALLKTTLLRRTKGTIIDGEPILSLPLKSIELRKVELSKEEVDFYKVLEEETRGVYKETTGMLNKDFKEVFARLVRLRQACNHPLLVSSSLPSTHSVEVARKLPYGSSKLKTALEILSDGLVQRGVKALVFSQWTKMLDLLGDALKRSSFQYRRFDGNMSMNARHKAIEDFNTLPEVNVMIMSLKAASVGLNLVAASLVLIMDPWWNPTTEDQAIDRVHRIGQTRPVKVVRLLAKDSVEDRLLALQEKKKNLVVSAFGKSDELSFSEEELEHLLVVD